MLPTWTFTLIFVILRQICLPPIIFWAHKWNLNEIEKNFSHFLVLKKRKKIEKMTFMDHLQRITKLWVFDQFWAYTLKISGFFQSFRFFKNFQFFVIFGHFSAIWKIRFFEVEVGNFKLIKIKPKWQKNKIF